MIYEAELPGGERVRYREPKRWLWPLAVLVILLPALFIWAFIISDNQWLLLAPLLFLYLVLPGLDYIVGADKNNPPDVIVPQLEVDPYFNRLLMLCIPAHLLVLFASAWLVGTQDLAWGFFAAFAAVIGIFNGLSINTAHEIGHKNTKRERFLSRVVLAITGCGHFCIDHNLGHHRDVATPIDPASARMGESIYRFAIREIPGAARRGWQEEGKRLQKRGLRLWSLDNQILQSYLMTVALQGGLILALGWELIVFFCIHNIVAWLQLTSANYIEHYGLLRERKPNGRYERCQVHHSWNANYYVSNLILFHLQRHSDHHTNPTRSYQSLRNLNNLPELPSSYLGMYVLAYIPALWFKVMDKRLLALPHIDGDLDKVNIAPKSEASLRRRWTKL